MGYLTNGNTVCGRSYSLLPCPYCGGEAEFRDGSSTTPYIRCKKCGCRTGSSRDEERLVRIWNRRGGNDVDPDAEGSDAMKRCPFCGAEGRVSYGTYEHHPWWAHCTNGHGLGRRFETKEEAIAEWNRRAALTDEQFAVAVHDGRVWKAVE